MAAIDSPRQHHQSTGRIGNTVFSLIGTLAAWNDSRVTRKTLGKLSDHELDDIGLVRGDIEDVARR